MRTASFRVFYTSGRRSRGRRSELLKLPINGLTGNVTGLQDDEAGCKVKPREQGGFACEPLQASEIHSILSQDE